MDNSELSKFKRDLSIIWVVILLLGFFGAGAVERANKANSDRKAAHLNLQWKVDNLEKRVEACEKGD